MMKMILMILLTMCGDNEMIIIIINGNIEMTMKWQY